MSIAVAAPPHRAPAMTTSYLTTRAPLALRDTLAAQHAGDVIRQLERVAADAVDEARVPAALKVESEDVEARHGRDAAVVEDLAAGVEHRDSQPRVRPTVTRRPDHRGNTGGLKVEARPCADGQRPRGLEGLAPSGVETGLGYERVNSPQRLGHLDVGRGGGRDEIVVEIHAGAIDAANAARNPDTASMQHAKIERRVIGPADELE